MYSMGNDYPVIKENLKLNSINRKSDFTGGKNDFDIQPFFSKIVNTKEYNGTFIKRLILSLRVM